MSKTEEKVKEYLDSIDYEYSLDEKKNIINFIIGMDNVLGNMDVYIVFEESSFIVYTYLNNKAEGMFLAAAGEYLHRANYGLKNGNFEIDYRSGKIRYKTFTNVKKTEISEEVIEEGIFMGVLMMEQYGNALLKVMLGEGKPGELIEESERTVKETGQQTMPPR